MDWPVFAKITDWELSILAHTRGMGTAEGAGKFARGQGAYWAGRLDVAPMGPVNGLKFRAFLHKLRGRTVPFNLRIPGARQTSVLAYSYTDSTDFDDGTKYSDVGGGSSGFGATTGSLAVGASSVTLTGVTGTPVVGDYATIGAQLVRIVAVSGSTIEFRPRLRQAAVSGVLVVFGSVTAAFRLSGTVPFVPFASGYAGAVQVEIEEFR